MPRGCGPIESPGVNVDTKPDVFWLYLLATVRLTRLRRRKVRSPSFLPAAKTAFTPLLLLSPPNPLTLGFGGDPVFYFGAAKQIPLGCAVAYPLASACCKCHKKS